MKAGRGNSAAIGGGANAKVAMKACDGGRLVRFSLTPALSRRERENRRPQSNCSGYRAAGGADGMKAGHENGTATGGEVNAKPAVKSRDGRQWVALPLTPALSRRERENRRPRLDKTKRPFFQPRGKCGSLSQRERVGVRESATSFPEFFRVTKILSRFLPIFICNEKSSTPEP